MQKFKFDPNAPISVKAVLEGLKITYENMKYLDKEIKELRDDVDKLIHTLDHMKKKELI